jgi:AP-3 complex subunit beta
MFYVKPNDPTHIALLKLDILVSATTEGTLLAVLRELSHYSKSGDPDIVQEAIRGVALCAMKCSSDKSIDKCAAILGRGIRSQNGNPICKTFAHVDMLNTPSTIALRTLIQLSPGAYAKYIHLLAESLGEIHSSSAKAEIIWLVGEYAAELGGRATDVLRISLQDFAEEVFIILWYIAET